MWQVPGNWPVPLSGQGKLWLGHLISWLEVMMAVIAFILCASVTGTAFLRVCQVMLILHSFCGKFLNDLGVLHLWTNWTAHFYCTVRSLRVKAGQVWQGQGCLLHTIMCVDLGGGDFWVSIQCQCQQHQVGGWYIHCRLSDGCWPNGTDALWEEFGKNRGMTLPPAPMSTLHLWLPHWFDPIWTCICTVAYASVTVSMFTSLMSMGSGFTRL